MHVANDLLTANALTFAYPGSDPVLKNIKLAITPGDNVGIVGESGSGKSTLLRILLGILQPTSGEVLFNSKQLAVAGREFRKAVQVVFQDPYSSLDPRQRIDRALAEPLVSLGLVPQTLSKAEQKAWIDREVASALLAVGLPADSATRYPNAFSGGQRQRIAIARAIISKPQVLLADEPVSALDVTTRVKIIELLQSLKKSHGLAIVMVSHDLSVVAALCNKTVVLDHGVIVESGETSQVLGTPSHPYTKKLIASLPRLPKA